MGPLKINDWKSVAYFNLRYNRWFLLPIGLWMPKKDFEKVLSQFCILFTTFMLLIDFVPHTLYILLAVADPAEQLILFGPLSFSIMAIAKYALVISHIPNIATCVRFVEEDWEIYIDKPEEKKRMVEAGQMVDNFIIIYVVFMIGGTTAHNIFVPLIEKLSVLLTTPNVTVMLHAPYYFGSKIVYKDSSDIVVFAVCFLVHSVSFVYMNIITVGLGILSARFVMHSCCQIEILLKNLELTVNKANDENWNVTLYQANIKLVIVKHLRILRFIGYTEDIFTGVFFVEVIMSTLGICVLGYYIIGALANKNIPQIMTFSSMLVAYIITIYVYCHLGNYLTTMCEEIGVKAYEINWTDLIGRKYGNIGIQMIILVAQHPPVLTAGKTFYLSVENFTSVMKASAAYLNMLRTVTTGA